MPTILKKRQYRFFFYSNEGNPAKAPHIHVRSPDGEAEKTGTTPGHAKVGNATGPMA